MSTEFSVEEAPVSTVAPLQDPRSWAIIGSGFLGMELARKIRAMGHAVTLFEASPSLGGLADAWKFGPITWDRHYHVTLLSDLRLRKLLHHLGLENQLEWVQTRTGFYTDGKLYSMSNSWEFLKFPPLGLLDKFRLAGTIFYASKIRDSKPLENISVVDWLRKLSGDRTTEKIWLPLLRAKLGENYQYASASFIWAIIARMYAARKSGLKKEMFGYVRGGYAKINDAFAKHLMHRGVNIRSDTPVLSIKGTQKGLTVQTKDAVNTFDRVVVTTACPAVAKMCPDLVPSELERLKSIRYQGIVCASVLLRKPLAGYYVTNITDAGVPFTAVIEMTALIDPMIFGGKNLIYLPKYVDPADQLFDQSNEQIRTQFTAALLRMYPQLTADDILDFQVSRVRNVLAISTLNYSERVPPMSTSIPGLYLVNSSQIVNGTLNVNETLMLADRGFEAIMAEVRK